MIILLPLVVCLVGLLMYVLATNPKVAALGMEMFKWGLLAFLLIYHTAPLQITR